MSVDVVSRPSFRLYYNLLSSTALTHSHPVTQSRAVTHSRPVLLGFVLVYVKVHTHYPCSGAVNTGVILHTREERPSRSAGAVVNDLIIISTCRTGIKSDTCVHGP